VSIDDSAELLAALGLNQTAQATDPRVHAECIRIARRLRAAGRRTVGLVPATRDVAVPPIAVRLGAALVELTGSTAAFVDANVRWPALATIAARPSTDSDDSVYSTRWLSDSLALLTPPAAEGAGKVVPHLERVLEQGPEIFQYLLVDLTGFDRIGGHAAAAQLVDGVIVIGRAGHTREADLLRFRDELWRAQLLGVLLYGARARRRR
jgi:hypothetical protein